MLTKSAGARPQRPSELVHILISSRLITSILPPFFAHDVHNGQARHAGSNIVDRLNPSVKLRGIGIDVRCGPDPRCPHRKEKEPFPMSPSEAPCPVSPHAIPDSGIGEMLVTSRSLAEYRAMFALSDADLRGTILDCPGGASSATAEINAAGGNARAADPLYGRGLTAAQLAELTQAETDRGNAYVRAHPDQYRWRYFNDADHHHASRSQAGQHFARDYAANPQPLHSPPNSHTCRSTPVRLIWFSVRICYLATPTGSPRSSIVMPSPS